MIAVQAPEFLMKRQQIALTAFLISPIVVTVLLCYAIAVSIKEPRRMDVPAVGAGAGNTGGANAIGELIAHGSAKPTKMSPKDNEPPAAAQPAAGQIEPESLPQGFILIVQDKSGKANPSSPIFVASNYGKWNAGDPAFKLEPQSDMRWRITVKRPAGSNERIEFKFTRGDWALEELNADMSPPGNRTLPMIDAATLKPGEQPKFELTVPHWGDEKPENAANASKSNDPYRKLNVTGDVRRLQVAGGAGAAPGAMRDLLVWLPPGYSDVRNAQTRYPVIYLHDGQNVFEQPAGVPGEWSADETATSLVTKRMMQPVIIVAVPNSGPGRNSEYMPFAGLSDITPRGEEHVAWLMSEVLPRVEGAFRVKAGPENTCVGGSSLGAVISLYAAAHHPEKFGLVLAESLPLRSGEAKLWDDFTGSIHSFPRKIYLGIGTAETGTDSAKNAARNREYVEAVEAFDKTLDKAGLGPDRRLLIVEPDALHNEQAWARRLPRALSFLFPPPMDGTK